MLIDFLKEKLGEDPKLPSLSKWYPGAVAYSGEFRRIEALPRRDWRKTYPFEQIAQALYQEIRKPKADPSFTILFGKERPANGYPSHITSPYAYRKRRHCQQLTHRLEFSGGYR